VVQQIQDGGWPPFGKKLLNSHISVTVWPIFRFWWNLVWCCILEPGNGSIVKILNFWKSKMSAAAILNKTQKSWYLHNGLIDLHKTWYADAIWASYPLRQIKKWISQIQDVGRPILMKFGMFCAIWPHTADRPLKFWLFENSKCRRPPFSKYQKSGYLRNGLTDIYEIWYDGAEWFS